MIEISKEEIRGNRTQNSGTEQAESIPFTPSGTSNWLLDRMLKIKESHHTQNISRGGALLIQEAKKKKNLLEIPEGNSLSILLNEKQSTLL